MKLKKRLASFKLLTASVFIFTSTLGMSDQEKIKQTKLDVRNYMKYMLKDGTLQEKRDLMQSFTSKLILINKRVVLE